MNFRQRLAWLLVLVYLFISCLIVYYIFDAEDKFSNMALEHAQRFHKDKDMPLKGLSLIQRIRTHITDIPFPVWFVIFFIPYIQLFCVLVAFTKSEPRMSPGLLWPVILFMKIKDCFTKPHVEKAVNSPTSNGHILFDT